MAKRCNGSAARAIGTALAWLVLMGDLQAARAEELCVPNGSWSAPTIDGDLDDLGWVQASRFVFQNGTANPPAALQVATLGASTYFALEVHDDVAVDGDEAVFLAFGTAPAAKLVRVRRVLDTTSGQYQTEVRLYDQGNWAPVDPTVTTEPGWHFVPATPPPGAQAVMKVIVDPAMSTVSWVVELSIPTSWLPAGSSHPFYAAMIVSGTPGLPTVVEHAWPRGALIDKVVDRPDTPSYWLEGLPPPPRWGTMKRSSTTCAGMYVSSWAQKIRVLVNGVPGNVIQPGQANEFEVLVANNGPATYDQIKAAFFYQHFGMGGVWTPIPPPSTTPQFGAPVSVAGNTTAETRVPGPSWTPPTTVPAGHACVSVMLDQGAPATTPADFQTRGGIQNMEFGPLSSFSGRPVISAKGLQPVAGEARVRLALRIAPDVRVTRADARSKVPAGTPILRLNVPIHGYQFTGRFLTVNGHRREIVEPVSSFAYVLDHALPAGTRVPAVKAAERRMRLGPGVDPFAPPAGGADPLPVLGADLGTLAPPRVAVGDFGIRLGKVDRWDEANPLLAYLDLAPGELRELEFGADYAEGCLDRVLACSCHRIPGPALGLVGLGLLALAPRRRRRQRASPPDS